MPPLFHHVNVNSAYPSVASICHWRRRGKRANWARFAPALGGLTPKWLFLPGTDAAQRSSAPSRLLADCRHERIGARLSAAVQFLPGRPLQGHVVLPHGLPKRLVVLPHHGLLLLLEQCLLLKHALLLEQTLLHHLHLPSLLLQESLLLQDLLLLQVLLPHQLLLHLLQEQDLLIAAGNTTRTSGVHPHSGMHSRMESAARPTPRSTASLGALGRGERRK